jgi:hypothetical protein
MKVHHSMVLGLCLMIMAVPVISPASGVRPMRVQFTQSETDLQVIQGERSLKVSLKSPELSAGREAFSLEGIAGELSGAVESGKEVVVDCAPMILPEGGHIEVEVHLEWSKRESILRKWARLRLMETEQPLLLREVILDRVIADAEEIDFLGGPWQSYPAFVPGFFLGIEYPVATTRVKDDQIIVAHQPGIMLQPGQWFETRRAVYGVTPPGREKDEFMAYIESNRPEPKGLHFNYNSWWTSPVPFTEDDIQGLMKTFKGELYQDENTALDTFAIDLGWSKKLGVWEIDEETFPEGFKNIQDTAESMDARLGLWISPSNFYSPHSFDNEWADEQGYETFVMPWGDQTNRLCCLGGEKYATKFRGELVDMLTKYGIRHVKLDGYYLECPEKDHGHEPGRLGTEAIAEGGIAAFKAMREAAPDVWLETTCFGWNPSPWWLFYVNSVIGTFGDDYPHGRVPCPVYRESYTTGRDFFNLQGASLLPVPIAAQEVLGIIHQNDLPFLNDGITAIMRGHSFMPLYFNPKYMDDSRYETLAELMEWARDHEDILAKTKPLLQPSWQDGNQPRFSNEADMPREPYGYAHWDDDGSLVMLRNTWIEETSYTFALDESIGVKSGAKGLSAVSLYPQARVYARELSYGDELTIPLMPYETLVLSLGRNKEAKDLPSFAGGSEQWVQVASLDQDVTRIDYVSEKPAYGPDWTSPIGDIDNGVQVVIHSSVECRAARNRLLILLEGKQPPETPMYKLKVNGKEEVFHINPSTTGFAASSIRGVESWLFLERDLPKGAHEIEVSLTTKGKEEQVSAWLLCTEDNPEAIDHPDALPTPAWYGLGSACLLPLTQPDEITTVVKEQRPVETIDGVFVDTLEPVTSEMGWSTLQRNKSIWQKPMTLGGKRYFRGLGTHSPGRVVYDLEGKYSRFKALVGVDGLAPGSVTFEVKVDGQTKFKSGVLRREDQPEQVDVDVSGAQKLELIIGDAGDGLQRDHANWANAVLLY